MLRPYVNALGRWLHGIQVSIPILSCRSIFVYTISVQNLMSVRVDERVMSTRFHRGKYTKHQDYDTGAEIKMTYALVSFECGGYRSFRATFSLNYFIKQKHFPQHTNGLFKRAA